MCSPTYLDHIDLTSAPLPQSMLKFCFVFFINLFVFFVIYTHLIQISLAELEFFVIFCVIFCIYTYTN